MTIDEKAEATPAAIPRCSRSDCRLIVVHSGCSMLHVLIWAILAQRAALRSARRTNS